MDRQIIKATISKWFEQAKAAGLILSGEWFGRPFDVQFRLTYLEARPHKVLLEFNQQFLLIFTDLKTVRVENSELVFEDYAQFIMDWQGFVNMTPHVDIFSKGEVRLMPPIGTVIKL